MFRYLFVSTIFIVHSILIPFGLCGGFCGYDSRLIRDPSSCRRYQICMGGQWKIVDCPLHETFDGKECSLGPCQILSEDQSDNLSPRSASRCSKIETTIKCFKSSMFENKNGRKVTTLWYYNSAGSNYKLSIYGDLPDSPDLMISWLELNGHHYKRTPIPHEDSLRLDVPAIVITDTNNSNSRPTMAEDISTTTKSPIKPEPHRTEPPTLERPASPSNVNTAVTADDVLPEECGLVFGETNDDKIIYWKETPIEEVPWQVSIIEGKSHREHCAGSIISVRHVLSVAHCFISRSRTFQPKDYYVRAGYATKTNSANKAEDHQRDHIIRTVFVHDKYDKDNKKRNDIALIMIEDEFKFGRAIFPICLPDYQERLNPGRECHISGFDQVQDGEGKGYSQLLSAKVRITTDEDCKMVFMSSPIPISGGMVCAGDLPRRGRDQCQQDSGGPLSCQNERGIFQLFGVTSLGFKCDGGINPRIYTKIPEYVRWIRNRIEASMRNRGQKPTETVVTTRGINRDRTIDDKSSGRLKIIDTIIVDLDYVDRDVV